MTEEPAHKQQQLTDDEFEKRFCHTSQTQTFSKPSTTYWRAVIRIVNRFNFDVHPYNHLFVSFTTHEKKLVLQELERAIHQEGNMFIKICLKFAYLMAADKSEAPINDVTECIHLLEGMNTSNVYHQNLLAVLCNLRGYYQSQRKLYHNAVVDYSDAVKIRPDYARAHCNRGVAYHFLQDYDMSLNDYSKSIDLDANDHFAYYNRAITYQVKRMGVHALRDSKIAATLAPSDESIERVYSISLRKVIEGSARVV